MNRFNVTFKGMSNVPDDGFGEAGDMALLLNMRHKGGELVQCQPPAPAPSQKVEQALYHAQSGYWLELSGGILVAKKGDKTEHIRLERVESFALMGNIVIMYLQNSVEYAIWKPYLEKYVDLGALPSAPDLKIDVTAQNPITTSSTEAYYNKFDEKYPELFNRAVQKGFVDQCLAGVYDKCGYTGRAFFKVAYRMFDGNYVQDSKIYQASIESHFGETEFIGQQPELWVADDNRATTSKYTAKVNWFKAVPMLLPSQLKALKDWEDIIVSIDIFSTGSIMSYKPSDELWYTRQNEPAGKLQDYRVCTKSELRSAILDAAFWKIGEYDINGNEQDWVKNTSPSHLSTCKALSVASMGDVIGDSQTYNGRLHTYNPQKNLFAGYGLPKAVSARGGAIAANGQCSIYVFLKTDDGEKIVKVTDSFDVRFQQYTFGYFVYPDSRAYKMEIYDGAYRYTIPLVPHRVRNEAYCLATGDSQGGDGIDILGVTKNAQITSTSYSPSMAEPTVDDTERQRGILKVSAVDNPFYFPTAQTYKFEGEIVGLASNAEAISTGQFGQYPLFVFTQEGIWAMGVDTSGMGAYTAQSPFSREVCSGAICPVSGGIVFTTRRGVMAISGGQVTELSSQLDGPKAEMLTASSNILGQIAEKGGSTLPDVVPVREYIEGAKLAYNYLHNEVILSNVKYPYSYVYALTDGFWSIIDTTFDVTTNSYPELVVYNSDKTAKLTFDDGGNGTPGVLAVTRPFTLGSLEYKRLRQAALRCTYEPRLNFYLLGSNDGANYACITGKETERDTTRRDLVTAMSRSRQYKYFAIAFAGQMKGRVTLAELLVDAGMNNNKLG